MMTAAHAALDREDAIMQMDARATQYVTRVALRHRLNAEDRADMLSAVRIEVIKAIDRWRPNTEASLETYVTHRIKGAIIDHQRRVTLMKRAHYDDVAAGKASPVRVRTLLDRDAEIATRDDSQALLARIDCETLADHSGLTAAEHASLFCQNAEDVALEFGVTESTVQVYSSRAIQRMRATVLGEQGKMTTKQFEEACSATRKTQKSALPIAGGPKLPPATPKPRFLRSTAAVGGRGGIRWGGYRTLWFATATE